MDYYSVISRFDPQRHEFYRYEFRWPARLQCTVRILMVTDGPGFGSEADLPRLVDAVTADAPYHVNIEVTTAHHAASGRTGADIDGFRFTTHGIEAYDQIWILGARSAPALSTTEVAALWEFMQGGGGLFVTGAPDSGLSAGIPRVASMLGSAGPPSSDGSGVGSSGGVGSGSGSGGGLGGGGLGGGGLGGAGGLGGGLGGGVSAGAGGLGGGVSAGGLGGAVSAGGVVRPTMYPLNWQSIGFRHSVPHPIMCGRDGPITVLPDHAGQVEDPVRVDLTARARVGDTVVVEYPRCGTIRVPPQVIATGASPVDGSEFGVASAYDGHLVSEVPGGVGRVVVDTARRSARDLDRYAAPHDAVRAAIIAGGTPPADQVALADHWRQLKDYYQNVAIWLARPATQQRIRQLGLLLAANHVDALMTWRPVEPESPVKRLPYLRDLGTRAQDAFHRIAPRYHRDAVTADALRRLPIYAHLHPMPFLEPVAAPLWQLRLFDSTLVEQVALGGAVDALHRAVSEREYMDVPGERLDRVARAGAEAALAVLVAELRAGVETMTALFHPADDPPDPCTAGPRTIVHSR